MRIKQSTLIKKQHRRKTTGLFFGPGSRARLEAQFRRWNRSWHRTWRMRIVEVEDDRGNIALTGVVRTRGGPR